MDKLPPPTPEIVTAVLRVGPLRYLAVPHEEELMKENIQSFVEWVHNNMRNTRPEDVTTIALRCLFDAHTNIVTTATFLCMVSQELHMDNLVYAIQQSKKPLINVLVINIIKEIQKISGNLNGLDAMLNVLKTMDKVGYVQVLYFNGCQKSLAIRVVGCLLKN